MNNVLIYCGLYKCKGFQKVFNPKEYDKAYGFEPNPDLFKQAVKKYKSKGKVEIVPYALGDKQEKRDFYIFSRDASSSLSNLSKDWIQHWKKRRNQEVEVDRKIQVKVVNLYEWVQQKDIGHIRTLVTDLQGMDFTVLNTMRPMFEKGLIEVVRSETEYDDCETAYPELPSNKRALFDDFFKDLPYEQITGPLPGAWNFKKMGTHQDITWRLTK